MNLTIFRRTGTVLPFFQIAYCYIPMTGGEPLRLKVRLLCVCHVNSARTATSNETFFSLN